MLLVMLALLLILLALTYYYFTSTFSYWKDRGVIFLKPYPVLGSMVKVMTIQEHLMQFQQRIYQKYDSERFVGFFQGRTPALLVRDPELIRNILVKDFAHFTDHGLKFDEEYDPLQAKNLFHMQGQRWKEMRAKLTPTFTSGRMKAMFPLVLECATELETYLGEMALSDEAFEAKEIMGRYTTNVIGSCAFGIKCDSLRNPDTEFRAKGTQLLKFDFFTALKSMVMVFLPELSLRLRLIFISKELSDFFRKMVHDVIAQRNKTGEVRKDFIQLLMELKEKGRLTPMDEDIKYESHEEQTTSKIELSDDDLTAQAVVFFIAGFETSSGVLSFALLELAVNPDIQKRAREEIEEVIERNAGQLTYQAMQEMKYLDCILEETLRKYPPISFHQRVCTKQYVIPETSITIDEGTSITIPAHALQNDPKYFPDPERFDPDRFNEEQRLILKNKYVYLPFGEGPRHCIGNRFALMQSKLGLVAVLRKYEILTTSRTKYPIELDIRQFMFTARDGAWVKLAPIKEQ